MPKINISKGLEALNRIGKVYYPPESKDLYFSEDYGDDFDIIEKELNRLEELEKEKNKFRELYEVEKHDKLVLKLKNEELKKALEILKVIYDIQYITELDNGNYGIVNIVGDYIEVEKEKAIVLKEVLECHKD